MPMDKLEEEIKNYGFIINLLNNFEPRKINISIS